MLLLLSLYYYTFTVKLYIGKVLNLDRERGNNDLHEDFTLHLLVNHYFLKQCYEMWQVIILPSTFFIIKLWNDPGHQHSISVQCILVSCLVKNGNVLNMAFPTQSYSTVQGCYDPVREKAVANTLVTTTFFFIAFIFTTLSILNVLLIYANNRTFLTKVYIEGALNEQIS